MPTYLVTGGAGFIGSNLVLELVARGHAVRVVDNLSTGYRKNLAEVLPQIELVQGDLRSLDTCRQAVEGVDYVLHHAAIPSVQYSVEDPLSSHGVGVTATLNLLVAARDAGVKRLVFASSSAVYGDSPELPHRETLLPQPKSPYAVAKLSAEQYCRIFTEIYGLETVCLRYFNVFGPRQDPTSPYSAVISIFIKKMLSGDPPVIYGDGHQSRDFIFVSNNVEANLLVANHPAGVGGVFNIASGQRYSLLDLVAKLNNILGTQYEPVFAPPRSGEIRHSQAAITRAEQELGFNVKIDFETGLEKTVTWYKKLGVE